MTIYVNIRHMFHIITACVLVFLVPCGLQKVCMLWL